MLGKKCPGKARLLDSLKMSTQYYSAAVEKENAISGIIRMEGIEKKGADIIMLLCKSTVEPHLSIVCGWFCTGVGKVLGELATSEYRQLLFIYLFSEWFPVKKWPRQR